MKIKNFGKIFVSFLLSVILLIPYNVSVFASNDMLLFSEMEEIIDSVGALIEFEMNHELEEIFYFESFNFEILEMEQFDEYEALRSVMAEMTPEAMAIFSVFLANNPVALETHILNVDANFHLDSFFQADMSFAERDASGQNMEMVATAAVHQQVLNNVFWGLSGIGLSAPMINIFLGIASSLLANPFITAAIVVSVLTAFAVYQVIVGNWTVLSPNWANIRATFASAFSPVVSSAVINTGFNSANTTFNNSFTAGLERSLGNIAQRHGIGRCIQAAAEMTAFLSANARNGVRLVLNFQGSTGHIWSRFRNMSVGMDLHHGVRFNGRVFYVVFPGGVTEGFWINDFTALFYECIRNRNTPFRMRLPRHYETTGRLIEARGLVSGFAF